MTSLYNRATPSQRRILRAIEGAIKNTTDAHPALDISPRYRRSIAKRATGTLTAQWLEVLAAEGTRPSDNGENVSSRQCSSQSGQTSERRASQSRRSASLIALRTQLTRDMKRITRNEAADYTRAMIDVLRMIDAIEKMST